MTSQRTHPMLSAGLTQMHWLAIPSALDSTVNNLIIIQIYFLSITTSFTIIEDSHWISKRNSNLYKASSRTCIQVSINENMQNSMHIV
jgi:hypothetical protein